MLRIQQGTDAYAFFEMWASGGAVRGGERTNAVELPALTKQHIAATALIATILLSGYMVAVG